MKFAIIATILIIGGGVTWYLLTKDEEQPEIVEVQRQDFPQAAEDSSETLLTQEYSTEFEPGFSLSYPEDWNVIEGADNSTEAQLVTFESPQDSNLFYFCLDLYESGDELTSDDIEVVSVDIMSAGTAGEVNSVLYTGGASGTEMFWSLGDDTPEVGEDSFVSQITNDSGRKLQVYGRFNCREETKPSVTLDQFTNSLWVAEAKSLISTLNF